MTTHIRLPHLFSVDQVAEQLGVSSKTVRRWIERRELHVHQLGRQLRVAEEDLSAFLNARRKSWSRSYVMSFYVYEYE